jgi:hypothetical protein
MERLFKEGKLIADSRTNLARSGTGVEVQTGAPKPDVGTIEAFKRALLNAKSIGYLRVWGYCNSPIGLELPMASNRKALCWTPMRLPSLSPTVNSNSAWSSLPKY